MILDQSMPFRMKKGGWFDVELHYAAEITTLKVSRDGVLALEEIFRQALSPGFSYYYAIHAFTGAAASEHSVRNIVFEGITPDNSDRHLTEEEL